MLLKYEYIISNIPLNKYMYDLLEKLIVLDIHASW
jgi:hypothetical protein